MFVIGNLLTYVYTQKIVELGLIKLLQKNKTVHFLINMAYYYYGGFTRKQ